MGRLIETISRIVKYVTSANWPRFLPNNRRIRDVASQWKGLFRGIVWKIQEHFRGKSCETILARDNVVPRLSSTVSWYRCTVSFNRTRTIEGWGDILGPPPPPRHCLLKPRRQSASDYFRVSVETARPLLFVFNASPSSSIHPFLPAPPPPPRMSLPPKPREEISRSGNCGRWKRVKGVEFLRVLLGDYRWGVCANFENDLETDGEDLKSRIKNGEIIRNFFE